MNYEIRRGLKFVSKKFYAIENGVLEVGISNNKRCKYLVGGREFIMRYVFKLFSCCLAGK